MIKDIVRRKPTARLTFKEGDRVKMDRHKGTVDEMWFDDGDERVSVVWDHSGCCSDYSANILEKIDGKSISK